ncbi:MAG: hypothetical protein QNJ32_11070 [Xenococcaceae cyanobacterium MO_167.B27]|nr:hypothetical protein [Xenococcaceae cyanobacterium MO_167.B27]
MMKKVSYSLTICAAIAMTILPATAMEAPSSKELTSTNDPTDATSQIKNATDNNNSNCVYISWAGVWQCY